MKHIIARLKLLFQGKFWAFWHYGRLGFTSLTYRGIPIIKRDDIPSGTIYFMNLPDAEIVENFLDWGKTIKENPRRFGKIKNMKEVKNESKNV